MVGDQPRFELVEVGELVLKGLPDDAYLQAYLSSAPFVRTDCVPDSGDC